MLSQLAKKHPILTTIILGIVTSFIGSIIYSFFDEKKEGVFALFLYIMHYKVTVWVSLLSFLTLSIVYNIMRNKSRFSYNESSKRHDLHLYESILKMLPSSPNSSIRYIRTNSITMFDRAVFNQFSNFIYELERDTTKRFLNPILNNLLISLIDSIKEFSMLKSKNTFSIDERLQAVAPELKYTNNEAYCEKVKELNNASDLIIEAYDNFVERCRRELLICTQ